MAKEILAGLFVGGDRDCPVAQPFIEDAPKYAAIVHACKFPCHATILGYNGKGILADGTKLSSAHAGYLVFRADYEGVSHLYLNMIDAAAKFFHLDVFRRVLDFMQEHGTIVRLRTRGPLGVHCNQGQSRAPSIMLLYLTKRLGLLPGATYDEARAAFTERYPEYRPGEGIAEFLAANWVRIE